VPFPCLSGLWIHALHYPQVFGEEEAGLYGICVPGDPDLLLFGPVALDARGDQVFPGPPPSTGFGDDVINGEFMVSERFAAVGTSKIVPVVNHHPRWPIHDYGGSNRAYPHYYGNGELLAGAPDFFSGMMLYYQTPTQPF